MTILPKLPQCFVMVPFTELLVRKIYLSDFDRKGTKLAIQKMYLLDCERFNLSNLLNFLIESVF